MKHLLIKKKVCICLLRPGFLRKFLHIIAPDSGTKCLKKNNTQQKNFLLFDFWVGFLLISIYDVNRLCHFLFKSLC